MKLHAWPPCFISMKQCMVLSGWSFILESKQKLRPFSTVFVLFNSCNPIFELKNRKISFCFAFLWGAQVDYFCHLMWVLQLFHLIIYWNRKFNYKIIAMNSNSCCFSHEQSNIMSWATPSTLACFIETFSILQNISTQSKQPRSSKANELKRRI
jgi:hypothetical protein